MKRFKKLGVALLSATLLLIPYMTSINAQDNPYDTWKTTALKSPSKGQLVAAGDIKISWNSLEKVQIPNYKSIIKSISSQIEEREREEFSKTKIIKNKKINK